jgi:hypothetical protein
MSTEPSADQVTIAYYYRVRWGFADEFLELFRRNHYPILAEQLRSGRLIDVRAHRPRFHGAGDAGWTFLVTITYRDWASVAGHADAEVAERLFPDQDRHRAEERRRFELLEAHWDVVLEDVPLGG